MKSIISFLLLIGPMALYAESIGFSDLWKRIEENSSARKSKYLEWKAGEIAKERTDKHWLPRVYTDLRTFQTNDPTLNFMGKLSQRSATDSDFSTASTRYRPGNFLDSNNQPYSTLNSDTMNLFAKDTLNYPGSHTYSRGTLGMDFPLYEGGSGKTLAAMNEKRSVGLKFEWLAVRDREFAQTGFYYRAIQTLNEYKQRLEKIKKFESKFQSNYSLGNKGNPVGYAGYLALKSIKNQISVLEKQSDLQINDYKETLYVLSDLPSSEIEIIESDLNEFLDVHFKRPINYERSNQMNAQIKYAEGEKLKADMETAKFLPKVGAYSEAYGYHGSRNTANAYQAGVYLQMNLYNPKDMGVVEESKLNAEAALKKLEEKSKEEVAHVKSLFQKEISLMESLVLVKETVKYQDEQIINMQKLFQSGAINAIQFAETLNKSLELNRVLMETEIAVLQVRTETSLFSNKEESNESIGRN
ncbi:transporter [Leptospira congkakensis]|uniref:Transporter n=1 Tax=Leptospira congkakensis TaxID=2484932 RepID=A0A4Z1A8V9_9LEPT|nr:TolC family protein [Leptospira congkakensis]TGL87746.1 transporter [Leptospira congkakensis]TGL89638.1 transporter [Leptospira congkakensis]TGL95896.1 transporter [Leptospira congkakensis]